MTPFIPWFTPTFSFYGWLILAHHLHCCLILGCSSLESLRPQCPLISRHSIVRPQAHTFSLAANLVGSPPYLFRWFSFAAVWKRESGWLPLPPSQVLDPGYPRSNSASTPKWTATEPNWVNYKTSSQSLTSKHFQLTTTTWLTPLIQLNNTTY